MTNKWAYAIAVAYNDIALYLLLKQKSEKGKTIKQKNEISI